MASRLLSDEISSFKISRSRATANGFASDVDPLVRMHLDELNTLLGKKIFPIIEAVAKTARSSQAMVRDQVVGLLKAPLTPKKTPKELTEETSWADHSLASYLSTAQDDAKKLSIADYIDETQPLAELKYAFQDAIQQNWLTLSYNARTVLEGYPHLAAYLIAYAYHVKSVQEVSALKNFITNNKLGARRIADYSAVSGARSLIDQEQLKVESYNDDDSPFVTKLTGEPIILSAMSFSKTIRRMIHEFVFDRDEESIVRSAKIFPSLPADLLPQLVKYIQRSPLPVTSANVDSYLPGIVLQLMPQRSISGIGMDSEPSDERFRVQFEDSSDDEIEINKSAVLCAAQLYHGMVLGDELDVFGAVHYLAHRRMNVLGGMRIEDKILSDDLQRYVFDNQYIDLGGKEPLSGNGGAEKFRTRPAERQMFQRQVFDEGNAEMPEEMLVNDDFKRLWKVLMLESARYLDRAQASMNPESFVSRQNVMQAVEDLQYNLSTHCTGMATVISPAVDAELNFVLTRILKHKEILRQVLPEGGTWKRAIDRLNGERRKQAGPATTLYNKATLGKGIIEMIASYTPAAFEDDSIFSAFISKVDAFITTQSILTQPKRAARAPEEEHGEEPHERMPELIPPQQAKHANGAGMPADEWDF